MARFEMYVSMCLDTKEKSTYYLILRRESDQTET
jgi:hypothetical protein